MKKQHGQFMTTRVDKILKGFERYVKGQHVIDLYCGKRDLLKWAVKHGARSIIGYDIDPAMPADIHQDTLMKPPEMGGLVLINPPYLYINKADNNAPFNKYDTADLYKCALLSLTADKFIAIVPSNFIYDADDRFRERFYSKYAIKKIVTFEEQVFEDTNVRVCAIYAEKGCTETLMGYKLYKTKLGYHWHKYTDVKPTFTRLTKGKQANSCLTIRMTDTGSKGGEIKAYIADEPYYGKTSDRNIMTVILPDENLNQYELAARFNARLNYYRQQYGSCFLTNFLAGRDGSMRKRMSFRQALQLLTRIAEELK